MSMFSDVKATANSPEIQKWFLLRSREEGLQTPTDAKNPNKYKHKRTAFGIPVVVENPRFSTRTSKGKDGQSWSTQMFHDYGYIPHTRSADDEGIDCYIGTHEPTHIYVVHQVDPATRKFDEHKLMIGFRSMEEATRAYLLHYDKPDYFEMVFAVPLDEFKDFLSGKRKDFPVPWKRQTAN